MDYIQEQTKKQHGTLFWFTFGCCVKLKVRTSGHSEVVAGFVYCF